MGERAVAAEVQGAGWPDPLGAGGLDGPAVLGDGRRVVVRCRWTAVAAIPPEALTCAVLAVVCARHAGRTDLVIGSVPDRRVMADLAADPTLAELAATIADRLGPTPADAATDTPDAPEPLIWHGFGREPAQEPPAAARLWAHFVPDDAALTVIVRHDERALERSAAAVLLDHLAEALRHAVAEPGVRCSALRLADDGERRRIAGWSAVTPPAEPPRPIHELVAAQAARTPDAMAVTGPGHRLTYRELDTDAAAVAGRLAAHGLTADGVVAVLAERSVELVVLLLGILKAGGAYLVIHPGAPAAWLAEVLRDAGPALVVSDRPAPVPAASVSLGLADLLAAAGNAPEAAVGHGAADVRQLAYVSYTSGTTGVAKGVAVDHKAVARLIRGPNWADFGPGDVFLLLSAIAFDASTLELWAPLANGGRLVVHPAGRVAVDELAALVRRERVTHAWFTAGLFHQLIDAHLDAFGGLRHVFAGGDVVSAAHLRRLLTAYPSLRFTNGYGPTENTTFTTCWTTTGRFDRSVVPIGQPIRGTGVTILSDELDPVPVGVPGELYAGGSGLARGYRRRPGETAAAFVPDPAPGRPGARLYRTGDLARWRPDGDIEFLGRSDAQVKVRGYRVEPLRIAALLEEQPEVRQAVVVAEDDEFGAGRLVGYVVLAAVTDPADLRGRLAERLPAYLVPARVVPLDGLPLTPTGKIDRSRLGRGPQTLPGDHTGRPVEAELADIWSKVLGVAPTSVHDNFFELGGNSLVVSQLILEMERTMGCRIPARTVFRRATIASMADAIVALRGESPPPGITPPKA